MNIYPAMTEEEIQQRREKTREFCIQYVKERRDLPKDRLELIWRILTSRGEETLMYGPMPDLYAEDMGNA